jgi:hypothetical protein
MTDIAPKKIVVRLTRNGPQRRNRISIDPATGACVISPDLDRIIRKALKRAARHIALRLYLHSFDLKRRELAIKLRYALLSGFREVCRVVFELMRNTHNSRPIEPNL